MSDTCRHCGEPGEVAEWGRCHGCISPADAAIYAATYGARMAAILDGDPIHESSIRYRLMTREGKTFEEASALVHEEMVLWRKAQAEQAKADARLAVELHRGE